MVQGSSFVVKARQVCATQEKATHLCLARMVDGVPEYHFVELLPQDITFQVNFGIIFVFSDLLIFSKKVFALSYLIFIPAYKVLRSDMYDIQSLTPCRA